MRCFKISALLAVMAFTASCGIWEDLLPSGQDKRGVTTHLAPGAKAPDFSLKDIHGAARSLSGELAGKGGAVIYFAMWCPICDSHMQSILQGPLKRRPDVSFLIIDYVSGSVESSLQMARAGGYEHSAFIILVDERQKVLSAYGATMGTTVVVNGSGTIMMIEDYKDDARLEEALAGL